MSPSNMTVLILFQEKARCQAQNERARKILESTRTSGAAELKLLSGFETCNAQRSLAGRHGNATRTGVITADSGLTRLLGLSREALRRNPHIHILNIVSGLDNPTFTYYGFNWIGSRTTRAFTGYGLVMPVDWSVGFDLTTDAAQSMAYGLSKPFQPAAVKLLGAKPGVVLQYLLLFAVADQTMGHARLAGLLSAKWAGQRCSPFGADSLFLPGGRPSNLVGPQRFRRPSRFDLRTIRRGRSRINTYAPIRTVSNGRNGSQQPG